MSQAGTHLDDVDRARALVYRLLGHALAGPPTPELLGRLARLQGGEAPIGAATRELAARAAACDADAARREYDALFIGIARGELVPYASFYITGFLHERPLARLRGDLARIGLQRAPGRSEPEDHIATVCDAMAELIERSGAPADAAGTAVTEEAFFARHVEPWAGRFFADLERAAAARLYEPLGTIGRSMIELDRQGFAYAAGTPTRHTPTQRTPTQRGAP